MENKNKVVIGGTFDLFHKGHEALLRKAFEIGIVSIGLTSDRMVIKTKNREIEKYEKRKNVLLNFAKKEGVKIRIKKIEDRLGFTLGEDFDYIVVSKETYKTALEINKERKKNNRKPIQIVKIDFVLAKDGKPISSTKIFKKEINRDGDLS